MQYASQGVKCTIGCVHCQSVVQKIDTLEYFIVYTSSKHISQLENSMYAYMYMYLAEANAVHSSHNSYYLSPPFSSQLHPS